MRKANETGQTVYQVKHGLLSEYLCKQLKSPAFKFKAASVLLEIYHYYKTCGTPYLSTSNESNNPCIRDDFGGGKTFNQCPSFL